jgi:hypothetical protein
MSHCRKRTGDQRLEPLTRTFSQRRAQQPYRRTVYCGYQLAAVKTINHGDRMVRTDQPKTDVWLKRAHVRFGEIVLRGEENVLYLCTVRTSEASYFGIVPPACERSRWVGFRSVLGRHVLFRCIRHREDFYDVRRSRCRPRDLETSCLGLLSLSVRFGGRSATSR